MACIARQSSFLRVPKFPIFMVRAERSTRWRLSNEATHSTSRFSSAPRSISLGMSRIVRVTGATTIPVSTGMASERVTTRTGLRLFSVSAHQISPCRGTATKVPLQSVLGWLLRYLRALPRFEDDGDNSPRSQNRYVPGGDAPRATPAQFSLRQSGFGLRHRLRAHPPLLLGLGLHV